MSLHIACHKTEASEIPYYLALTFYVCIPLLFCAVLVSKKPVNIYMLTGFLSAPRVGLEPTTPRLTAACSTIELSRNAVLLRKTAEELLHNSSPLVSRNLWGTYPQNQILNLLFFPSVCLCLQRIACDSLRQNYSDA